MPRSSCSLADDEVPEVLDDVVRAFAKSKATSVVACLNSDSEEGAPGVMYVRMASRKARLIELTEEESEKPRAEHTAFR